jgi:hypothetical protein
MKCSLNGCRICPGMWVAAALLLFSLLHGLFVQRAPPPPSAAAGEVVSAQPAGPATDPRAVPPPGADAP